MQTELLIDRVVRFSKLIIEFNKLLEQQTQFVIAKQVLRAGTSIGASVYEAQFAESLDDFIHKMKIASKEASETKYWFLICEHIAEVKPELRKELEVIHKMINKSISTAKARKQSLKSN